MYKTAVITGGNRGIGLAITECFLNSGWSVVVGCRNSSKELEKLASENLKIFEVDVRNENSVIDLARSAKETSGKLDAWVNNAGYSKWLPITEINNDFLEDIFKTNLFGAFWGCKAAACEMTEGGSIINISSIAGKRGSLNNSAYVASKFGMNGLTQSLAKELGQRGIRVNGICPVLVETDGLKSALIEKHAPSEKTDVNEFLTKFCESNAALKFLPKAQDVAEMAIFLASEKASAITGQNINVDCGVFPQ